MSYTYAFVGLTPSERSLLESIFALDAAEGEDLAQVRQPEEADLLVVNGDDRAVIEGLRAANPRALMVLVGRTRGGEPVDLPVLRRPLEMNGVVSVLGALDWPEPRLGGAAAAAPGVFAHTFGPSSAPPTVPPPVAAVHHPSAFAPTTASMPVGAPARVAMAPTPVSARATWNTPEHPPVARAAVPSSQGNPWESPADDSGAETESDDDGYADVMVVIGPVGQRRPSLPSGIRRLGWRVRVVEGPERALELLGDVPPPFVFLDQQSLGEQLLPLVRGLKALRIASGQSPQLVVVARGGSAVERLSARLAGCTWMKVPIDRARLQSYFARHGLHPRA